MAFSWFDIVALVIVVGMCFRGFKSGGVVMAGNVASVIAGFVATAYVVAWLNEHVLVGWSSSHPIAAIIGFVVIFLVVVRLLGLAVSLLDKVFRIVSLIPLVGPANRLLGFVIGLAEGCILVLVTVYVIASFLNEVIFPGGITYDTALVIVRNVSLLFPSMVLGG